MGKGNFDNPDRVFVRAIQGEYNLTEELRRLRSLPRVRKGAELEFTAARSTTTSTTSSPRTGWAKPCTSTSRSSRRAASREARPRQRGRLLHPRRRGCRGPRRHPLRVESRRHRDRPQQLRPPALQPQPRQTGARARHEDEADVPVHEHALPEDDRAEARPHADRRAQRTGSSPRLEPRTTTITTTSTNT